jgi:pimeloyl-ACP methyl ester carboxylesterase
VVLLDVSGMEPVPVVGHSLGALVGLALAASRPDRVAALVLLDPPLDAARPNPDVPEVYRLRQAPPGELERYLEDGGRNAPLVARVLAATFRQAASGVFEEYLAAPPGAPWAWDAAASLQMPALVIQADPQAGGVLGNEAARAFVSRLPQGKLVKLAGAPHALHAARAAEIAAEVNRFLRSTLTSG